MSRNNVKSTDIYLIGTVLKEIKGNCLPTSKQVMQLFFHYHQSSNDTIRQKAAVVAEKVLVFWERAQIPVCRFRNIVEKIIQLHKEWINVKKNNYRKTSHTQQQKEKKFKENLNTLFDITSPNATDTPTSHQRIFLEGQCQKNCRGFIPTMNDMDDGENDILEDISPNEKDLGETIPDNDGEAETSSQCTGSVTSGNILPDSNTPEMNEGDILTKGLSEISATTTVSDLSIDSHGLKRGISDYVDDTPPDPKQKRVNVITRELVSALDRTGTTDRNASYLFAAFVNSLGLNVNNYNISSSTIRRNRMKLREEIFNDLKDDLRVAEHLVAHWDGKMLPELIGVEKVERLAILITGLNTEQLLGIPKLESSTGLHQATAVLETMRQWNIVDRVKALCFDTTSSNTGRMNGACTLIEKELGREVLFLACRHHIAELILRQVFEICWPTTVGPNVAVFMRFQKEWPKIDTSQYSIGLIEQCIAEALGDKKDDILKFIEEQLQINQPRDDYRELLELALIFMGGIPPSGIRFKMPGAAHHARWLAKAIYCLKIFMFRQQFHLKAVELKGLREICLFIVLFYIKLWYRSPHAIEAPYGDLTLLQDLIKYSEVENKIARAALSKMCNHLWYLSETVIALGFFDPAVPNDVKLKMREAMKYRQSSRETLKRITIKETEYEQIVQRDLSYFVTQKSSFIFDLFAISPDFLDKDPKEWESDENYQKGLKILRHLKVTNDVAERGVALIQAFNHSLTADEDQRQYLLQVIHLHRKKYLNANKKNFVTDCNKEL